MFPSPQQDEVQLPQPGLKSWCPLAPSCCMLVRPASSLFIPLCISSSCCLLRPLPGLECLPFSTSAFPQAPLSTCLLAPGAQPWCVPHSELGCPHFGGEKQHGVTVRTQAPEAQGLWLSPRPTTISCVTMKRLPASPFLSFLLCEIGVMLISSLPGRVRIQPGTTCKGPRKVSSTQ